MTDSNRSKRSTTEPGAEKSATQKWEEAASRRHHDEPMASGDEPSGAGEPVRGGEPARGDEPGGGDVGAQGGIDPDDPRRETFLRTRDGVFYPSGYAVLGLTPDDAEALRDALAAGEFARDDMLLLAPEEAAAVMRETDREAGVLARIVGAEIRNARVMRQLADSGTAFLIVRVPDDDAEQSLVAAARRWPARKALRYHPLAVEELRVGIEEMPGDSPYGVNEVLRSKPTEARLKPERGATDRPRSRK